MITIEQSLRRPDWQPGAPLPLLNGETFHFRPPIVRMWRQYEPGGTYVYRTRTDLGQEYDQRLNESERLFVENKNIYDSIYHFADAMLIRNYTEEIRGHYDEILYFSTADSVKALWGKIYDLARGIDPKEVCSIG